MNNSVKLSDLIAPSFYSLYWDVTENKYTHYMLNGGRGSTKSSFISIMIILGIMQNPNAHAVAIRKVGLYLHDSVYEQLLWAIEVLGVSHLWKAKKSPLELIYTRTGQRIMFRGADKPEKIKSIKVRSGYIRYVWYEELAEFNGMEEIRSINQSILRGGSKFNVFYSYNPPASQRNWVNEEALIDREDRIVHHSTYLTVPATWLGDTFLTEAEHLKRTKPTIYEHEYLGEVTGTGAEVFNNLEIRRIDEAEIKIFDQIRRGIDFGYAADPFVYTVSHYDKKRKRLYIFDEIYQVGLSNKMAADRIQQRERYDNYITADSAEPKSIREMKEYGLRIRGAKKGPDSVEYGIKFLQSLEAIIIDPERCPNTKREFYTYELERDNRGEFKACYPDKNNHTIDAVRYALEDDMSSRKAVIRSKSDIGM